MTEDALRQQIIAANDNGGPATITLGADIALTGSLPPIEVNIDFVGTNTPTNWAINANSLGRVFTVYQGTVTITNLRILNARAIGGAGGGGTFPGGGGLGAGAAIFVAGGATLTTTNLVIQNAAAQGGAGGAFTGAGLGGGGGGGVGGAGGASLGLGGGGGGGFAGAGGAGGGGCAERRRWRRRSAGRRRRGGRDRRRWWRRRPLVAPAVPVVPTLFSYKVVEAAVVESRRPERLAGPLPGAPVGAARVVTAARPAWPD